MRFEWKWRYLLLMPLGMLLSILVLWIFDTPEQSKYNYYYTMGQYDTTMVEVDPRIEPYVKEFMVDAEYYGYDANHVYKLNSIVFGNLEDVELDGEVKDLHGVCISRCLQDKTIGNIILSEKLIGNDNGLRVILYHELGHWYGKEHLPVMNSYGKTKVQLGMESINKYAGVMHESWTFTTFEYIPKIWNMIKHNFFVRDMSIKDQKFYMLKFLNDMVDDSIEELECQMEEGEHTDDMCQELYDLESMKMDLDTMSIDRVRGMFEF